MKSIKIFLVGSLLLSSGQILGQDFNEAFNFSNLSTQGTARSIGFGNALGSVGGDFSCLSVNPAGIGIYRSSELSLTPSFNGNNSTAQYLGTTTVDNCTTFNFSHFGMVFTNAPKGKRYEQRSWKTFSIAFGMNKVADFNRSFTYQGTNKSSSASQAFESDANLNSGNDSTAGTLGYLGYQSYLLNVYNDTFFTIVPFSGGIKQTKNVQTTGGIYEYNFSFGGNYKEKILLGITFGFPTVNYNYSSTYTETVSPDNTNNPYHFNKFTYRKSIDITGSGMNVKIGTILKLNNSFRIGAAFHSPTVYSLSDISSPFITSNVNDTLTTLSTSNYLSSNQFDYTLITPWKGVLSATFIIKNLGFVTADYEYIDYASARYIYPDGFDNSGNSFKDAENSMNQEIKNTYKGTSNIRIGGELKLGKMFMVRTGIGHYGNPYKNNDNSLTRTDLSLGLGFHFQHFFSDFGYIHSLYENKEQPYSIDFTGIYSQTPVTIPTSTINYQINKFALTLGYKF